MRLKALFLILCMVSTPAFAISSTEVSSNIDEINSSIKNINHDLNKKQLKKKNLDNAINDSDVAISKSEVLLNQLKNRQISDKKQLDKIVTLIPSITDNVNEAESGVALLMRKSYTQIQMLQNSSDSIVSANDNLDSHRRKMYLLKLLNQENTKYMALQQQLKQLNSLSVRLNNEILSIDDELGDVSLKKDQLKGTLVAKKTEANSLQSQISTEKHKLYNLKEQQAQLNRLLAELKQNENQETHNNANVPDEGYEDNSSFLSRELSKPINARVIMAFGAMKNQTKNHGLLFEASNLPIYSISSGRVLYSDSLPGFGHIVVVNNGDNYVSIYGGVIAKVNKGDKVTRGQIIANSGEKSNQPMGGVYFELRHYGRPVNPNKLLN